MSEPRGDRRGPRDAQGPQPAAAPQTAAERRRSNRTIRRRDDRRVRVVMEINGESRDVVFDGYKTLLEVLREDLALTGTKHGCELGECGACAVLVDGQPVLSCLTLPIEVQAPGHRIVTVEGIGSAAKPHPVQEAFAELGASQCGYCAPGFIVT